MNKTPPNRVRDKRRAPRIPTSNFMGYVCLDDCGREISEGYGWTINLSTSGIQMETFRPIETPAILLLLIGLRDQILEIKGEVIHGYAETNRRYIYGIRLLDPDNARHAIVSELVRCSHARDRAMLEGVRDAP
jgi:hypothetical protein